MRHAYREKGKRQRASEMGREQREGRWWEEIQESISIKRVRERKLESRQEDNQRARARTRTDTFTFTRAHAHQYGHKNTDLQAHTLADTHV